MAIFVVEDDCDIRSLEAYLLKTAGYEVCEFSDSAGCTAALRSAVPEMVILDIMLPGEDGLALLRRIRADKRTENVPVMVVSAKTEELDKVRGLDLGADDYLPKPFGVMEFHSRVRALLRRATAVHAEPEAIECGGIRMDDGRRIVFADDEIVELTFKEYELLKLLLINRGIALYREQILDRVWGYSYEGETRTIDMHVRSLRRKLGACGSMIKTVHTVGYKLEE